ncbi:MAG: hypothetical protein K0R61_3122 [Microvirga sp.]|nr:hypothetical protein [Microvirga sp.]
MEYDVALIIGTPAVVWAAIDALCAMATSTLSASSNRCSSDTHFGQESR